MNNLYSRFIPFVEVRASKGPCVQSYSQSIVIALAGKGSLEVPHSLKGYIP